MELRPDVLHPAPPVEPSAQRVEMAYPRAFLNTEQVRQKRERDRWLGHMRLEMCRARRFAKTGAKNKIMRTCADLAKRWGLDDILKIRAGRGGYG